jgi:hypothetical protein
VLGNGWWLTDTGKAVIPMCLSPYFLHTTSGAFVQRQLLQCRTCGSQAFHVLDCCRNPDYVRVPTLALGRKLRDWLGSLKANAQVWLRRPPQRPEPPLAPEVLDAWEARPLVSIKTRHTRAALVRDADETMQEEEREPAAIPR